MPSHTKLEWREAFLGPAIRNLKALVAAGEITQEEADRRLEEFQTKTLPNLFKR